QDPRIAETGPHVKGKCRAAQTAALPNHILLPCFTALFEVYIEFGIDPDNPLFQQLRPASFPLLNGISEYRPL
ncbi:MAG: hypothetical protein IJ072_00045, partial [Oscillospiraceae bacterium]|nr:hypothetical protein [Oscillospiraceae bacterium]